MYETLQYIHIIVFGLVFCFSFRWRMPSLILVVSAILYLSLQDQMEIWNSQRNINSYLARAMLDSIAAYVLSKCGIVVASRQVIILICLTLVHVSAALEYYTSSIVMYSLYPTLTNGFNILQVLVAEDGIRDSWRNIRARMADYVSSSVFSSRDSDKSL